MASLRRRLRFCIALWLVSQAASAAALVPRDCCAAHRPTGERCHDWTPDAVPAPSTGHHHNVEPAAHHHGAIAVDRQHAPASAAKCRLMGACDGPMASFVMLLSNHGILPTSTAVIPTVDVHRAVAPVHVDVTGRFQPPDAPPPRA